MTRIYFPTIRAYADVEHDIKRGGSAFISAGYDTAAGGAYIGASFYAKFSITQPRDFARVDYDRVTHLAAHGSSGFARNVYNSDSE